MTHHYHEYRKGVCVCAICPQVGPLVSSCHFMRPRCFYSINVPDGSVSSVYLLQQPFSHFHLSCFFSSVLHVWHDVLVLVHFKYLHSRKYSCLQALNLARNPSPVQRYTTATVVQQRYSTSTATSSAAYVLQLCSTEDVMRSL